MAAATQNLFSPARQNAEREWSAPFTFIQSADTQMGLIDRHFNHNEERPDTKFEIELIRKAVKLANSLEPKPKFFVVCGDMVDAWPFFEDLHPDIPLVCVCGNHDIGDSPTVATVAQYRKDFGDDFFSFWVGGCKFLVINSQYFYDCSQVPEIRRCQDVWLASELRPDVNSPWRHLIGFQHIPPFVRDPNEQPVPYGPLSKTAGFFGFPDVDERKRFLDALKVAGMTKLFCGHYHRNAGGDDGSLEVVVTSAIGAQFGPDQHGLRLVTVGAGQIDHEYINLPV